MTLLNKDQKIHLIFISILLINYIFPLMVFGKITLFYHDNLDSEVVYNTVIGNFLAGNKEAINIFLNSEIQIEFLRRAFQPFSFLYAIFNPELAYWTIDFIVKITAYLSFLKLANKINSNKFNNSLIACLFASLNYKSFEGFGFSIMPYLIYLACFKKEIKPKHYLIIILFALNTDLVKTLVTLPIFFLITLILSPKKNKLFIKNTLVITFTFSFFIILSNFNLIKAQLFSETEFHRTEFLRETFGFIENFMLYFIELLKIPTENNWTLLRNLPEFLLFLTISTLIFLNREKKMITIFILILIINIIPFLLRTELVTEIRNSSDSIFKTFQFEYITSIIPLLFCILAAKVLNFKELAFKNTKYVLLFLVIFFQINSSLVPIYKKFFLEKGNYRNIYTFKEYYMFDDYKKIKNIVKAERVLSVGLDPLIAVINKISVIDGYHQIYPLKYKKKFRKIIEKELEKNRELTKYYDNWGNRVYAFINNKDNIELNYLEAKSLGASYIISLHVLESKNVELIEKNFENKIFLYKIM